MTPYQIEQTVVVADSALLASVDFPGRARIRRVLIARVGGGAIAADLYSRAWIGPAVNIRGIGDDGNGKARLILLGRLACKIGDPLTVASSPTVGYNTTHRVVTIVSEQEVITDQAYTADAAGGTVKVSVPSGEQPLYKVNGTQLTGTGSSASVEDLMYVNQDPLLNLNTGRTRKLYFKFGANATYRVSITADLSVAGD